MSGEQSLIPQYYPDDFQVATVVFAGAAVHDPSPVLYADRDLIIDEIVVGVHVAGGTSYALNFRASADMNTTSATSMCTANIDTANVSAADTLVITTDGVQRFNSSGVLQSTATGSTAINGVTPNVQSNTLDKGQWLVIDPTGTVGSGRAVVQIRFRSRPK
jgi:hypothetical protein